MQWFLNHPKTFGHSFDIKQIKMIFGEVLFYIIINNLQLYSYLIYNIKGEGEPVCNLSVQVALAADLHDSQCWWIIGQSELTSLLHKLAAFID